VEELFKEWVDYSAKISLQYGVNVVDLYLLSYWVERGETIKKGIQINVR
jgi:hypothetical protein